jgi:hypothetical protein
MFLKRKVEVQNKKLNNMFISVRSHVIMFLTFICNYNYIIIRFATFRVN